MTGMLSKAIREPRRAAGYALAQARSALLWDSRYAALRGPKVRGPVPHDPAAHARIVADLLDRGIRVEDLAVDRARYDEFLNRAGYERFPGYYDGGRDAGIHEKALEHFLAAELLGLDEPDVYVDVASQRSPAPRIYADLYRCRCFRQDLAYRPGLEGTRIGGDAASMPVAAGFASKIALHNAFEHFEGDSDARFIREAARVLRPGGRLCIVPLFMADHYAIQTDPAVHPWGGMRFEADAVLHCARGWRDRHGRFYDVPHLLSRLLANAGDLRMTVLAVRGARDIHPDVYLAFAALFEKPRAAVEAMPLPAWVTQPERERVSIPA